MSIKDLQHEKINFQDAIVFYKVYLFQEWVYFDESRQQEAGFIVNNPVYFADQNAAINYAKTLKPVFVEQNDFLESRKLGEQSAWVTKMVAYVDDLPEEFTLIHLDDENIADSDEEIFWG